MSTETVRLIGDGWGEGVWRWRKKERDIPIATVTTRMIPALRWAGGDSVAIGI